MADIYVYIELSGKFVPILKENWNAEDLNFSIHLLNLYKLIGTNFPNNPIYIYIWGVLC